MGRGVRGTAPSLSQVRSGGGGKSPTRTDRGGEVEALPDPGRRSCPGCPGDRRCALARDLVGGVPNVTEPEKEKYKIDRHNAPPIYNGISSRGTRPGRGTEYRVTVWEVNQ